MAARRLHKGRPWTVHQLSNDQDIADVLSYGTARFRAERCGGSLVNFYVRLGKPARWLVRGVGCTRCSFYTALPAPAPSLAAYDAGLNSTP